LFVDSILSLIRAVSSKDVQDLKGSIKKEIFGFLTAHLSALSLDDESGTVDTPIGEIAYTLANLHVHHPNAKAAGYNSDSSSEEEEDDDDDENKLADTTFLKPEDVEVSFSQQKLKIISA